MQNIKSFINTLKEMHYRSPTPIYCPKCKTTKIFPEPNYGILPVKYKCQDCDYEGMFILELEKDSDIL